MEIAEGIAIYNRLREMQIATVESDHGDRMGTEDEVAVRFYALRTIVSAYSAWESCRRPRKLSVRRLRHTATASDQSRN